jgi:hypothetical protein
MNLQLQKIPLFKRLSIIVKILIEMMVLALGLRMIWSKHTLTCTKKEW